MSRDFMPYELFLADRKHNFRNAEYTFYNAATDESIVMNGNKALKEKYPELYFLLDSFEELYNSYSGKVAESVFERYEEALKRAERELLDGVKEKSFSRDNYAITSKEPTCEEVTAAWFFGKLVHSFYYSAPHNDMFEEYIKASIVRETAKAKQRIDISDNR